MKLIRPAQSVLQVAIWGTKCPTVSQTVALTVQHVVKTRNLDRPVTNRTSSLGLYMVFYDASSEAALGNNFQSYRTMSHHHWVA